MQALSVAIFLILSACGGTQKSTNQQELDDRAELLAQYQPMTGVYEGIVKSVETSMEDFPIQVKLFIVDEANGYNEKGEVKMRPALRGYFTRLDMREDASDKELLVRYYVSTGEITMTTQSNQGRGGASMQAVNGPSEEKMLSLQGKYSEGQISGSIKAYNGELGTFILQRKQN